MASPLRIALVLLSLLACCSALGVASTADSDALLEWDALDDFDALVELESSAPVGEGASCTWNGIKGLCSAKSCSGTKFTGLCPGAANIQCCIKPVAKKTTAKKTTVKKTTAKKTTTAKKVTTAKKATAKKTTTVKKATTAKKTTAVKKVTTSVAKASTGGKVTTTSIPYKFPYATGRYIIADIAKQRIRVYDGSKGIREWKISSGINGIGFKAESHASPVGKFKIIGKYGAGAPLGMQFESLRAIGKIGKPTDSKAHVQTRILQLGGLDPENQNTASRAIYIHGTNAEMQLGWPGSHGCYRMSNKGVVELFNMVQTGTLVFVAPKNAWP